MDKLLAQARIERLSIPEPNSGCWLFLRIADALADAALGQSDHAGNSTALSPATHATPCLERRSAREIFTASVTFNLRWPNSVGYL
jgi:hypothetical protein